MNKKFSVSPKGVCTQKIDFEIDDDGNLHNVRFYGGCDGNTKAIGILVEGKNARDVADMLKGNTCGFKNTSCADQFSKGIKEVLDK